VHTEAPVCARMPPIRHSPASRTRSTTLDMSSSSDESHIPLAPSGGTAYCTTIKDRVRCRVCQQHEHTPSSVPCPAPVEQLRRLQNQASHCDSVTSCIHSFHCTTNCTKDPQHSDMSTCCTGCCTMHDLLSNKFTTSRCKVELCTIQNMGPVRYVKVYSKAFNGCPC